jgi:hypothetical protein
MSADIWLKIDTGAGESVTAFDGNITYNLGPMWRAAGFDGFEQLRGRKASDVVPLLRSVLERLKADPARFAAMNPPNGWGDYSGCVEFFESFLAACEKHPACVIDMHL